MKQFLTTTKEELEGVYGGTRFERMNRVYADHLAEMGECSGCMARAAVQFCEIQKAAPVIARQQSMKSELMLHVCVCSSCMGLLVHRTR